MRDTLIVAVVAVAAVAIGVFFFLYGGQYQLNTPPSDEGLIPMAAINVPFTEIAHGVQSSVTKRTNYLITSEDGIKNLWKLIDAKGNAPIIDFTQNYVAAVFAGQKMTGSYKISVSKVGDSARRMITVMLTKPGDDCITTQSITAPYQVIQLPKTNLSFTHEDLIATTSCSH